MGGKCAVFVDVNLYYSYAVAYLLFKVFEHGGHRFTGATPLRKEIDEHKFVSRNNIVELFHCFFFLMVYKNDRVCRRDTPYINNVDGFLIIQRDF